MKKSCIVVKYTWEEEEIFEIVITDGTSQKEIDSLPQEGLLEELKDDTCLNQSSASLEGIFACLIPQEGRGLLQICKATGIPPHDILLSSMQKVIDSQHFFLQKMKEIINLEFDKREVGHVTFQVQKQVE